LIKNAFIAENTSHRKTSILSSNNEYYEEVTTEDLAKKEFKHTLNDY